MNVKTVVIFSDKVGFWNVSILVNKPANTIRYERRCREEVQMM